MTTNNYPYPSFLCELFNHILPSSGLVNALSDEVCWERVLELPFVLKGVVGLGVRHAAALKPAVEHLCDPSQHALTAPGGDGQAVDAGHGQKFGMSKGGYKQQMCKSY